MQPMQLEQPLLVHGSKRGPRRKQREQKLWLAGLCLFYLGYLFNILSNLIGDGTDMGTEVSKYKTIYAKSQMADTHTGLLNLAYGFVQTLGLLMMTGADVNANVCIGSHRRVLLVIALFWIGNVSYWALLDNPSFWLEALPYTYLLLRFQSVLDLKRGFPRFSQLMTLTLGLELLAEVPENVADALHSNPKWPLLLVGLYVFCGGCCVGLVHQQARWQDESLTISLNMGIYTYLFFQGTEYLLYYALVSYYYDASVSIPEWLFGPVHIVPTFIMFASRRAIFKLIGKRWLKGRKFLFDDGWHFLEAESGSLAQVFIDPRSSMNLISKHSAHGRIHHHRRHKEGGYLIPCRRRAVPRLPFPSWSARPHTPALCPCYV
jgi:hypothetical protein